MGPERPKEAGRGSNKPVMRLAGGFPPGDLQPGRFPADFADYEQPHTYIGFHTYVNPLETQGLPASRITYNQGCSPQAEFRPGRLP